MTQKLITWADFTKGDAGWLDKAYIPPGFFTGEQIMLYRDGSIGPRSGVLDLAPTSIPSGTLYGLGYVHAGVAGSQNYMWIHKGTTLARAPLYDTSGKVLTAQAFAATAGSFAATPNGTSRADSVDYSEGATIFAIDGDKLYYVDWTTGANGTLTALASAPGGNSVEIFNEFLVTGGKFDIPNRIYWSAPGDFTSWPGANFVDLSGGLPAAVEPRITSIRRQRDTLVVMTNLGQVFLLTNLTSDPTTLQVRLFMTGDTNSGVQGRGVVRDRSGTIWMTRRDEVPFPGDEVYDAATAVPVSFDGASRIEVPNMAGYLRQSLFANDRLSRTGGVQGRHEKSFALTDGAGRVLVARNGSWTRHRLPSIQGVVLGIGIRGEMLAMNTNATTVYAWQFELERPPWFFSGSAAETLPTTPLDAGSALSPLPWFGTPELRIPGELISVSRIEVLFTSHATRDATNNHMDVFLQQYDRVDADEKVDVGSFFPPDSETSSGAMVSNGVTVGCNNSFDQAPPSVDHRKRVAFFPLADQLPAAGVRVLLRGLRGVSVHEINVYGDVNPDARP